MKMMERRFDVTPESRARNRYGSYTRFGYLSACRWNDADEVVIEARYASGTTLTGIAVADADLEKLIQALQELRRKPDQTPLETPLEPRGGILPMVQEHFPNASLWNTGGGCLAIGLHWGENDGYWLITNESLREPESNERLTVGFYDSDDNFDGRSKTFDNALDAIAYLARETEAPRKERLEACIARGKREILADIAKGIVPASVRDFGELHDYVDANSYGGAFENEDEWLDNPEPHMDFFNEVHDALHAWLQKGRPE